jgi:hypothetical protein
MNYRIVALLAFTPSLMLAQKNAMPTNEFVIDGNVKNKITFLLKDADSYTSHSLDSIVIYNHLQERKRVIKGIKGILLKDVIAKAGLNEEKPKLFSEFYFTCIASDGYKVVFSWNELFNSETGNNVLIITEEEGKKAETINDHIAIISATDKATGRRYVQNLQKVETDRVK